ncbi:hypothetical protein [Arsenophonus nasoniae]|uniref:Conserved hypothetical phage protein n=1 Tax=Arsenophonus nasoniae TaxID=638 RepID=D2U2G8_9GAMM|nr:hypothetical protein [Arsenophonus nasoniae]QBY41976.1 hypothetical protein ArsFIN_05090 [Arsenophonus nasoniae]WGM06172.1 hypothetical protein QE258_02015 [Arsenophonus nasoniae]CBA75231.1 conserved hypothetical phage protein [Arsenophonus nasoniae]
MTEHRCYWRKQILKMSPTLSELTCSMVSAHPFVYGLGQKTATGSYLSPPNAILHLAKKLRGAEEINVVVMMVCAKTQTEFMGLLQAFSTVFPLPVFSQVERMAKTAQSLQITKMQLPALPFGGLPKPQTLSTSSSRATINAQLIAQSKNNAGSTSGIDTIKSALTRFKINRESVLNAIDGKITELLGQSMVIWRFIGTGTGDYLAEQLQKDIPEPDAIFTLATLFAGSELAPLKEMLHDLITRPETDNHYSGA